MSGPDPEQIWESSLDEGERRIRRRPLELASTGVVGGFDVMIGILALVLVSGALTSVMPEKTAHVIGSLVFGIGFVFIVIGRSELFTENFLIPIAAVIERRGSPGRLARMWTITGVANLVGLTIVSFLFATDGVLEPAAREAAGKVADTFAQRGLLAAFLSALVAGTVMTLFTWMNQAVDRDVTRLLIALLVGFVLAAPSLNHAIVGFGEMLFGIASGTTAAGVGDLFRNLAIAVVGNLIGGVGAVTFTRLVQARAPKSDKPTPAAANAEASRDGQTDRERSYTT